MSKQLILSVLIMVFAVVLGCGGTGVLRDQESGPPDPEATVQAAVAATQAAHPTNTLTPEPTNTPTLVPTDTPMLTAVPTSTYTITPEPTSIPTVTPGWSSAAKVLYLTELGLWLDDQEEAMTGLWPLLENPQPNDEAWLKVVGYNAGVIQLAHENLAAMSVPPELAEFHEAVLDGTQDYYDAMDRMVDGTAYLNPDDMEEVYDLMMAGTRKLDRAVELIQEYLGVNG